MYKRAMDRPEGPLPLPPLSALRAFEAAARHGSFTRAARELCVTQTAISHQVRSLEEELDAALFERRPRRIELTEAGRKWAAALHPVFASLYAANRELRVVARSPARPVLSLTLVPSFAHWLVPRMGSFLSVHPEVDLHLSPSTDVVDMRQGAFDLAIRYGAGDYPGVVAECLSRDAWVPVCAPDFDGRGRLRAPQNLVRVRLLHDDDDGWRPWLERQGVRLPGPIRGPLLTDSAMVVDAATRGQGVGLVRLSLAHDALAAGRLVRLFPRIPPLPTRFSYYLVRARGRPRREVQIFREWLRDEIAALQVLGLSPGQARG
jgi:LysR family glycine cleavage system transcriptional activator